MELPWVDTAKHLGCRFGPKNHGLLRDLMDKRALYINKVNELNQEFHYAHPLSLLFFFIITVYQYLQWYSLYDINKIQIHKQNKKN